MNAKESLSELSSHGVSSKQIELLSNHLDFAKTYIHPVDPGADGALLWLKDSLSSALDPQSANVLIDITQTNKPNPNVDYIEEGYDSCQSQRKLAKVVGEAILLGGLMYEAGILGISLNLDEAQQAINSKLKISEHEGYWLANIAKTYGATQDFIFPGVTPSTPETPSIEVLTIEALKGKPITTVRTLTGIGGLRYDKDWNYVTDFSTFVELKVAEDKRYYPGIGIFYVLLNADLEQIPTLSEMQKAHPDLFYEVSLFADELKNLAKKEYQGISVLCSSYLPPWSELKTFQHFIGNKSLDLAQAFHSPSYEFALLQKIFLAVKKGSKDIELETQLEALRKRIGYLWSFNSTIHLPWTADLAYLSNDLMGRITNQKGDSSIRYGIGYNGQSVEIREYLYGQERNFPFDLAGKRAYGGYYYPTNDNFSGLSESFYLVPGDNFWKAIESKGFMNAAIEFIAQKHG